MAIIQMYVAVCDICGAREKAKETGGRYNETEHTIPAGWKCGSTSNVHICPRCRAKLETSED